MLKLPPGAELQLVITQGPSDFTFGIRVQAGSARKVISAPARYRSEEALLIAVETWAQDRLARLGLEKTVKPE